MDIEPHSPETNAFAIAIMDVAAKRYGNTKRDMKHFLPDVAAACKVDAATAYGWSKGYNLPNETQMEFLLGVIFQSEQWNTDKLLLAKARELFKLYQIAKTSIGDAEIAPLTQADIEQPTAKVSAVRRAEGPRTKSRQGYANINHDSDGMPPRQYTGNMPYSELDQKTLQQIQDTTASFPEFLRVSRLLFMEKGTTFEDFCQMVKDKTSIEINVTSICAYEIGALPSGTKLPETRYQGPLFETLFLDPKLSARAVMLLNRNRAQLAFHAFQKGDYNSVGARLSDMPPEYFTEQLQRCHERAGHTRKMDMPKLTEGETLIPIERDYQYLHALRKILGLSSQNVTDATGYSNHTVVGSETYSQLGIRQNMSETRVKLFAYYEQIAQQRGLEGLINRKVFESLGNGPLEGHRKHTSSSKQNGEGRS